MAQSRFKKKCVGFAAAPAEGFGTGARESTLGYAVERAPFGKCEIQPFEARE
jgi:hypothetical protein